MHDNHSRPARRWAATLILAVTAALTFTTLGVPMQSASAAPAPAPAPRNTFGAISLATDGAAGAAFQSRSKRAAFANSQRECKRRSSYPGTCTKIVWVSRGCAAVAARFDRDGFVTKVKWASRARTKAAAKRAAKRNFGGRIVAWVCTRT